MPENMRKQYIEKFGSLNLNLACEIVKKIVVENALEEIKKDPVLSKEI